MTFVLAHRVPAFGTGTGLGRRPAARRWRLGAPAPMTADQRAAHYVALMPLAVIGG